MDESVQVNFRLNSIQLLFQCIKLVCNDFLRYIKICSFDVKNGQPIEGYEVKVVWYESVCLPTVILVLLLLYRLLSTRSNQVYHSPPPYWKIFKHWYPPFETRLIGANLKQGESVWAAIIWNEISIGIHFEGVWKAIKDESFLDTK